MRNFISIAPDLRPISFIRSLIAQNHHSRALKLSLSLSSPLLTDQIYTLFLKSGHVLDTFIATTLITHFSKSCDFSRSLCFLFDACDPDIVSFNALFSGYAQFGQSLSCFSLYNRLAWFGLRPDRYTFSSLIKSCDSLEKITIAHSFCVKFGFNLSVFLVSGLIHKYSKFGCIKSSERCFEEYLEVDSVVWTSMINGYVWNGEFEKAREVFVAMRGVGLELTEFNLTSIVGALIEVNEGKQIHGFALKAGLSCGGSLHLNNVMMNMYRRYGCILDARKVFDEIPEPDVVSWTARIGAACNSVEALEAFMFMHSNNLEVNELTIINVFSVIKDPKLLEPGRQLHSLCHKAGYISVTSVCNALISMYGKCGQVNYAKLVFDELAFHDSISWNSLIGVYSENELVSSSVTIFSQMRDFGIQPDQYTLASILGAVSGPLFSDLVMQVHTLVIKTGFTSDDSMSSCLISSYGKCYNLENAKRVFLSVKESNTGHLQVMAASAVAAGCPAEALESCKCAVISWSEIDVVTFSVLLKACSAMTNLGQGRAIHSLALKSGVENDRFVETALIDFYSKCGNLPDAESIFRNIPSHNLAAWNAMITGYAQHGCYSEVLDLFENMIEFGIEPDEITYIGILQSCCHVGLVDEASFHLRSMFELHRVTPCLEHYASTIDLLGRVGLIREAKLIIDHMNVSADAHVWQCLLSACSNFGNLEVGEVAARELLKLQPENDSAYILLSNLYAKAGDWDSVRKLRKEMKDKLIHKEAGCSSIEVGGSVCHFLAEDISHPLNEQICFYLKCLAQQMRPLSDAEQEDFSVLLYSVDN